MALIPAITYIRDDFPVEYPSTVHTPSTMNRVVSIQQSEPGMYVITFQRSGTEPVGRLLEVIANPPLESNERASINGNGVMPSQGVQTPIAGAKSTRRRKR